MREQVCRGIEVAAAARQHREVAERVPHADRLATMERRLHPETEKDRGATAQVTQVVERDRDARSAAGREPLGRKPHDDALVLAVVPADGGRSVADIKRDMLLVEEQSALLDWHEKVGTALPRDLTLANVMTLGREYRDSVLRIADQYAPQIAGELGLEAHVVYAVLDRYLLLHLEKHIEKIDPAKVAASLDAGA